jgi:hypothetical protein
MAWVAPEVTRHHEPFGGGEPEMLRGFLQDGREPAAAVCRARQRADRPPFSTALLVGAASPRERRREDLVSPTDGPTGRPAPVRHAGRTRRTRRDVPRQPGRTRRGGLRPAADRVGAADEAVPPIDLDAICGSPAWGEMSLRSVYLHMIGECAGHCGQADLIRERIDGRTRFRSTPGRHHGWSRTCRSGSRVGDARYCGFR